ncbi:MULTISPECIES: hypothetical protein [Paenibacillus]|uniref:hypothetical protein n=1 Tax=Paenibacillus TaxID=44249 RepID=UPI00038FA9DD|nr:MULTISPECIES: hypothetical protein [Paenibacillus]KKC45998.1 hypothetical protein VE23_00910 [Paenibacillus sp. D9]CDN41722.1 hypothetical protein BN871_AJ_00740 [Paenibacillus sp. P22]
MGLYLMIAGILIAVFGSAFSFSIAGDYIYISFLACLIGGLLLTGIGRIIDIMETRGRPPGRGEA